MNDQELTSVLREWRSTPAPVTLEDRVFGPRPVPVPWWNRVPAGPLAALGISAGVSVIWLLSTLAPSQAPVPVHPAQAPTIVEPAPQPPPPVKQVPRVRQRQITRARPDPVAHPSAPPPAVDAIVTPPHLVSSPIPAYPAELPPLTTTVTVRLRIKIGKDGRVLGAQAIDADPVISYLAVEAVKQWLYEPEMLNGQPTETETEVSVIFGPRSTPARR